MYFLSLISLDPTISSHANFTIAKIEYKNKYQQISLQFTLNNVKILFVIKGYLKTISNIILPRMCFICEKKIDSGFICAECRMKIKFIRSPICRGCAKEMKPSTTSCRVFSSSYLHCRSSDESEGGIQRSKITIKDSVVCWDCRKKNIPYDKLLSCIHYEEPIKTLIHLFKYCNYDYLAELLVSLMIDYLLKVGFNAKRYDLMIPVPSHPIRLKEREYNQSYLLAKGLSSFFKVPLRSDIIFCSQLRPSQTKLKKELRYKNVEDIFEVKNNLENKEIILVDDIITTGATISECAKALKEKKASLVTVITLAKAR